MYILIYLKIRFLYYLYKFNLLKTKKLSLHDSKKIPIIIISFNQLFYLEKLIACLRKNGFENIVIIDNNSTYKPLLEYFNSIEKDVKIERLQKNYGHLVFWRRFDLFAKYCTGYYVVTDADIVPFENCPSDFLVKFADKLDQYKAKTKVGFGLEISSIPDTNPNKTKIIDWENKFWVSKIDNTVFDSDIDTTFALYRPYYHRKNKNFKTALRFDYPYVALHGGWYINLDQLTEEQQFYFDTANNSSSWKINKEGQLINDEYANKY